MRIDDRLKKTLSLLRYPLAILPMLWIASRIDFSRLGSSIHSVAWWCIPITCGAILLGMTIQGIRWWMLLRAQLPNLPFGSTMSYHFAGLYYGLVLPSSAGQDLFRAILVSRTNDYAIVWGATWICRLLGLIALAMLSLSGFLRGSVPQVPDLRLYAIGSFLLLALLIGFSFSKKMTRPIRKLLRMLFPTTGLLSIFEKIREGVYRYRDCKKTVLQVMMVTLALQLIFVLNAALLIKGISGRSLYLEALTFIPLIEIACLTLPLTPNGMGIREGLFTLVFSRFGLTAEQIAMYVAIGFLGILLRIVGILFVPFVNKKKTVSSSLTEQESPKA